MQETASPLGAIENPDLYQFGVERDGCLGNTVASMVSTISGQEYKLPAVYFAWRGMTIKDELRTVTRHVRKNPEKSREDLELALHRLDQRVFKMILKAIGKTDIAHPSAIPIALILERCDIEYRRVGFLDLLEAVNDGYQVAIMYKLPADEDPDSSWHMAHIGISKSNEIVRLSDGNRPINNSTIRAIDESATYLNNEARTWNFVALKGKF